MIARMSLIAPTLPTEDELRHAAETPGLEFVDGELREKPMSLGSDDVANLVAFHVTAESKRTDAGRVFPQSACYRCYPDDPSKFRRPDVSFVRKDRLPKGYKNLGFMPIPADLVVEVISPHDVGYDIEEKVAEYLAAGFGTVWVVWPNVKTVRVHRAGESSREFRGDDEITGEPFLPTFRCAVRSFFE